MPEHDILDGSVNDFLDRLAQRCPVPGGGSVAALAGSLACAMARMVLAYSQSDDPVVSRAGQRLGRADEMMRQLVSEDVAAYEALSAANKAAKSNPNESGAREGALATATMVPAEMAAVATEALTAMDEMKGRASKYLISDLGVAASLARACVESAGFSVRVNLREMRDPQIVAEFSAQLGELRGRADALAGGIIEMVDAQLQRS